MPRWKCFALTKSQCDASSRVWTWTVQPTWITAQTPWTFSTTCRPRAKHSWLKLAPPRRRLKLRAAVYWGPVESGWHRRPWPWGSPSWRSRRLSIHRWRRGGVVLHRARLRHCVEARDGESRQGKDPAIPESSINTVSAKRSYCAEVSFQPSSIGKEAIRVHDTSSQVIKERDADIREDLYANVALSEARCPRDQQVRDGGVDRVGTINDESPGGDHSVHENASDFSDGHSDGNLHKTEREFEYSHLTRAKVSSVDWRVQLVFMHYLPAVEDPMGEVKEMHEGSQDASPRHDRTVRSAQVRSQSGQWWSVTATALVESAKDRPGGESEQRNGSTSFADRSISARRSLSRCAHWPWGTTLKDGRKKWLRSDEASLKRKTISISHSRVDGGLSTRRIDHPDAEWGTRACRDSHEDDRGESRPQRRTQDQLLRERWRRLDHHHEQQAMRVLDEDSSWPREARRESECNGSSHSGCSAGASREEQTHQVNERAEELPMLPPHRGMFSVTWRRSGRWRAWSSTPTASEKSGPTAGEKSRANCRQRKERTHSGWKEQSQLQGQSGKKPGQRKDVNVSPGGGARTTPESQAWWRQGGVHVHLQQRECEQDAGDDHDEYIPSHEGSSALRSIIEK